MNMKLRRFVAGTVLVLVLAAMLVVALNRDNLYDWWKLRSYTAPASVIQLAAADTMTAKAQHLFYVNHPNITAGSSFTANCPSGSEKTIVLGCYKGGENGIYVYDVTDARLNGVEQVTAAHEMLHAAYERLSSKDRKYVDGLLTDYYQHDLHDQRILDTMAAYKKSEPNDLVNEMHSVFGTEIANLPTPLENYYKQYFADRSKVTGYAAAYQSEFTSRQAAIANYDAQLRQLKAQIDSNQASLTNQRADLDQQAATLQAERRSGNIAAYNAGVNSYNAAVDTYNSLVVQTKGLISQYNEIVDRRNAVVLEEQQLTQAITANPQTVQ